jgi:hypothetical protein
MLRDFLPNDRPQPVDGLIEAVKEEMLQYGPTEPEYIPLMEKLERLHALKAERPKPVSRDTLIMGAVHLFGILIIVFAERDTILPRNGMAQIGRVLK